MRHVIALITLLLLTVTAAATPSILRDGANHHLGDDSFVARFGRAPTSGDDEKLRMRVHLEYVRALLAAAPATRPELEARRAALLGYLGEYIAKGITPKNTYVARRNPVFIDAEGNICAVGYLIERSVNRALPEKIAATHRLDYLEDIAAAMPEVATWVDDSGFTLDELASIQPGYPGPEVMHMEGWQIARKKKDTDGWQDPIATEVPDDGKFERDGFSGRFKHRQMVGAWKHELEGKVLGKGAFDGGTGTWTSFRADGTKLATGPFVRSHANGEWRIFHPSGRLAAVGNIRNGKRDGTWTFFYDTKDNGKLSVGTFVKGETVGGWRHFDQRGNLVATASGRAWTGLTLEIVANKAGVRHEIHQGIPAESDRMDGFYLGTDKLYVLNWGDMFDGRGNTLERTEDGWVARACKWSAKRRAAARRGDATTLHEMILRGRWHGNGEMNPDNLTCNGDKVAVGKTLAKRYDLMIASRDQVHAAIPKFDVDPQPKQTEETTDSADEPAASAEPEPAGHDNPADFTTYLTSSMTWYIEWPHVDDTFRAVYRSLPGYFPTES
jgi:hypothetical protein